MLLHGLTEVLYNIPFLDVLQYLPIEGHLRCFQVLTIRNKASVDILVQLFFFFLHGHNFLAPLGKYQREVGLLCFMVRVCLII